MDFDSVTIRKAGNTLLMTSDEFMELPVEDRATLIKGNQVEFIKEGKVISNKEVLERVKTHGQSSFLVVLNGSDSLAKRIHLTSTTTSLSKTGKQTGSIVLTAEGYVVKWVRGAGPLTLNGKLVTTDGVALQNGDVIETTGTRLKFFG